ncbi:MAG: hypothetical protein HY275_17655 [Gemmatimonadetes bacterium]|nr:hypothetical protein [Gemmatimonadota bacterium]
MPKVRSFAVVLRASRVASRFAPRLAPRLAPRFAPRFAPRLAPRLAPRFAPLVTSLVASLVALNVAHAQRADTARTKAWLLAVDRALAGAVAEHGVTALVEALAPDAAVLIPGQPILRGREAEPALVARYGGASRMGWRALAAVASTDATFGCTVGLGTYTPASDSTHRERGGTYLACWRRTNGGVPRLIGLQRSDAPATAPLPSATFDGGAMPHSATERGSALREAQDADAAFAEAGGTSAGPGEAFAKWVAEDGLFPGTTSAARGPALMREAFAQGPAGRVLLWGPTRDLGFAAGGLAFTVGEATNKVNGSDSGQTHTKYFTVWRRERDGSWRWIFDLGSPRP